MPIARQNAVLLGYRLTAFEIMPQVKHSFSDMSKHCLLPRALQLADNSAMLEEREKERLEMAARLREALACAASETQVAEACGVTIQALTSWKKTGHVAKRHLPIIAKESGKSLQWLMGVPDTLGASGSPSNTEPGPDIRGHVPLISWVQAGAWSEAVDLYAPGDAEDWVACAASHGPRTFALRVHGDSMTAPHGMSIPAGNLIYVDPDQRGGVASGDLVIAKLCGTDEVTFKRFVQDAGRCFLQPLNPHYPPIYDEFQILGRVIGSFQSFNGQ